MAKGAWTSNATTLSPRSSRFFHCPAGRRAFAGRTWWAGSIRVGTPRTGRRQQTSDIPRRAKAPSSGRPQVVLGASPACHLDRPQKWQPVGPGGCRPGRAHIEDREPKGGEVGRDRRLAAAALGVGDEDGEAQGAHSAACQNGFCATKALQAFSAARRSAAMAWTCQPMMKPMPRSRSSRCWHAVSLSAAERSSSSSF